MSRSFDVLIGCYLRICICICISDVMILWCSVWTLSLELKSACETLIDTSVSDMCEPVFDFLRKASAFPGNALQSQVCRFRFRPVCIRRGESPVVQRLLSVVCVHSCHSCRFCHYDLSLLSVLCILLRNPFFKQRHLNFTTASLLMSILSFFS